MRFLLRVLLPAAVLASAARAADPPPAQYGRDRLVDIEHVRVELSVDIPHERAEGAADLTFSGINDGTTALEVDAVRFEIRRVAVDGREAAYDYDARRLRVRLDPPLAAGERRTLRVEYAVAPRNGLYFVHGPGARRDLDQCWSQGETEENRSWFPVQDDPAERVTSETLITVPEPLSVVSNGRLLEVTPAGKGLRTFHHRIDFPHAPYLVSIAAGDWATKTGEWEGVELTYHAPRAREADMDRSFSNTPRILAFLSKETGVKYPYPVYRQTCVSEYIWGGMENIAATTLNDSTLHDERAQPDWPSDSLVAHEAAHQWFGDYVTCKDWSDTWLNEGFATYYGALSMGDLLGPDQLTVEIDGMRQGAIGADSGANRRPVVTNRYFDEGDMFDGHSYAKGGMVLRMLRRELGDEGYRKSITAWLTRFAGKSANTTDLLAVIEDVTGRDVSRFFGQWLFNPGQPDLKVSWKWKDGDCAVTVTQSQASENGDNLFDVPLDLQAAGDALTVDRAIRLTKKTETFHFACEQRPKAVLVDPQGFLLRTLKIDRDEAEAAWVLAHDAPLQARLEAARELKDSAGLPGAFEALTGIARDASAPWALRKASCESLELSGADGSGVLLAILAGDADSRVRAAAAGALAQHRDEGVVQGLEKALTTDASYAVRAAAARSLGKSKDAGVDRVLEAATTQASHREEVLGAALDGLAERRSPRLAAIAERLAGDKQPTPVRTRGIAILGRLAKESLDAADRARLRDELIEMLDAPLFRVRMAAADALVTAGDAAALPVMRRIAATNAHDLTRSRMRGKIDALEAASAQQSSVAEIRRALEDERKKREQLEERVRDLEARLPPDKTKDAE